MKINEKNLACFAVSNSPIDKEGWLLKKGEVNKSFQRRWFVLKGNLLFYCEKKTEKNPTGVVILEGCTIELAEYEEQYAFKIVFHGAGDRTYILGADTQETMESWMKALACASYDYMKLMVSELQRQLDEIIELEKAHATSIYDGAQQAKGVNDGPTIHAAATSAPAAELSGATTLVPLRSSSSQLRRVMQRGQGAAGQRINPFDRCQSEEEFVEKAVNGGAGAMSCSSAPGTPQTQQRHHQQKQHGGSFKKYCDVPSGKPIRPNRRTPDDRSRKNGNVTSGDVSVCRSFQELHEKYGVPIKHDIHTWQRKAAVGQLISFD